MHRPKMMRRATCWGLMALIAVYLFGCGNTHPASTPPASSTADEVYPTCNATKLPGCHIRLLVFSKTAAFRHASIPDAIAALRRLAASQGIAIDFTEDSAVFTDANLARYNAVVFLLTTGTILDANQQAAFERYIEHGGGFAGVHSASDTEYNWPWYGQLVGAYFDRVHGHSKVVPATVYVVDHTHPSTSMLPAIWIRTDEWYNFATNPSKTVHVLLTVDERTYQGGVMGANHPIAWYHTFDGGRSWYTAMGHTSESYSEPLFLAHLWGGILYAAGAA
jgi:type 1 glutamine amidotransferase